MVTGNTELGREAVYHIWHEVTVGDVGVARHQGQAVRGAQPQLRGAGGGEGGRGGGGEARVRAEDDLRPHPDVHILLGREGGEGEVVLRHRDVYVYRDRGGGGGGG